MSYFVSSNRFITPVLRIQIGDKGQEEAAMLKMKSGNPNFISLPYPRTRHNGRIQTVTSGVTDHHSITD